MNKYSLHGGQTCIRNEISTYRSSNCKENWENQGWVARHGKDLPGEAFSKASSHRGSLKGSKLQRIPRKLLFAHPRLVD